MRIGILSDLHAGLGRNDAALRTLQTRAMRAAVTYLGDADLQMLVINGDVTDHLANSLSHDTSIDIAREQLAPLVELVRGRRAAMQTVCIAGNTDWPLASKHPTERQVYFGATGFASDDIQVPPGGLMHYDNAHPDIAFMFTHGHACKPEFHTAEHASTATYAEMMNGVDNPSDRLLERIAATGGSHRMDYIKASMLGLAIKPLPRFAREKITSVVAGRFTAGYEQHVAGMLDIFSKHVGKKALAVIGHTHVAGMRTYGERTVLNTGTAGAKPNPLQRNSDPRGHVAVIDTNHGEVELIQTFNAARPNSRPTSMGHQTFSQL